MFIDMSLRKVNLIPTKSEAFLETDFYIYWFVAAHTVVNLWACRCFSHHVDLWDRT